MFHGCIHVFYQLSSTSVNFVYLLRACAAHFVCRGAIINPCFVPSGSVHGGKPLLRLKWPCAYSNVITDVLANAFQQVLSSSSLFSCHLTYFNIAAPQSPCPTRMGRSTCVLEQCILPTIATSSRPAGTTYF